MWLSTYKVAIPSNGSIQVHMAKKIQFARKVMSQSPQTGPFKSTVRLNFNPFYFLVAIPSNGSIQVHQIEVAALPSPKGSQSPQTGPFKSTQKEGGP